MNLSTATLIPFKTKARDNQRAHLDVHRQEHCLAVSLRQSHGQRH